MRASILSGVTDAHIAAAHALGETDPAAFAEIRREIRSIVTTLDTRHAGDVESLAALLAPLVYGESKTRHPRAVARAAVAFARKDIVREYAADDALIAWDPDGTLTEGYSDDTARSTYAGSWQGSAPDGITRTGMRDALHSLLAVVPGTDGDTLRDAAAAYLAHDPANCDRCGVGRRPSLRGILAHLADDGSLHGTDRKRIARAVERGLQHVDADLLDALITEGMDTRPAPRRRWDVESLHGHVTLDGAPCYRRGPASRAAWQWKGNPSGIRATVPTTVVDDDTRTARRAANEARREAHAATLPAVDVVETVRPVFVVDGRGTVTPVTYRALGWDRTTDHPHGYGAPIIHRAYAAPVRVAREATAPHAGEGRDVVSTAPAPEHDRRDDGTVRAFKAVVSPRKRSGGQTGPTVPARLSSGA